MTDKDKETMLRHLAGIETWVELIRAETICENRGFDQDTEVQGAIDAAYVCILGMTKKESKNY